MRSRIELRTLLGVTLAVGLLLTGTGDADAQTTQRVIIVPVPSSSPPPTVVASPPPPPQPVYAQPAYAQPAYTSAAPAPARQRSGPNIGLVVSGSVLLGVGWIANFLIGLGAGTDPFTSRSQPEWDTFRGVSFIPIGGPWAQLAVKPTGFTEDYWAAWLIIDGILQGAGTILLIAAIATSVGGDDDDARSDEGGVQWALVPTLSPSQLGLSVLGSF